MSNAGNVCEESDSEDDIVNFLKVSTDSEDDDDEVEVNSRSKNIISAKCDDIIQMQIKNRISHKATSRIVNLLNSMPGISIKLPKNPIKHIETEIKFQVLFNCDSCNEIVIENFPCDQCGRCFEKNSKQNNFFIYVSLEQQIRRLLNKYFHEIINYLNREQKRWRIHDKF